MGPRGFLFLCLGMALPTGCGAAVRPVAPLRSASSPPCEASGLKACESACAHHDADACIALGETFRDEYASESGRVQLLGILDPLCGKRNHRACVAMGRYLLDLGVESDRPRVRQLYEASCGDGDGDACDALGSEYLSGVIVPIDAARGTKLFREACDRGSLLGCHNLAIQTILGDGTPADQGGALRLLGRACAGGLEPSCVQMGYWYQGGLEGIPKNLAESRRLFEGACQKEYREGCAALGNVLVDEPDQQAFDRGIALLNDECGRKTARGCWKLAKLHEEGRRLRSDPAKAVTLYERACEGDATHCAELADLYAEGRLVAKAPDTARDLYERACFAGVPDACLHVETAAAQKHGVDMARKACKAGDATACDTVRRFKQIQ